MDAKQPDGGLTNATDRFHLAPRLRERRQASNRIDRRRPAQAALALQAGEGGHALHLGGPPDQHFRVALVFAHRVRTYGLGNEQRDHRGAVPEPHLPERRSSSTASTALAPTVR